MKDQDTGRWMGEQALAASGGDVQAARNLVGAMHRLLQPLAVFSDLPLNVSPRVKSVMREAERLADFLDGFVAAQEWAAAKRRRPRKRRRR